MNKKAHYQTVSAPTLFVTKNKQRVKQNNNVVYLSDGDEFELELFNPTQKKVLAKITINSYELDSGIVLRPGERVFLERYINEAKKFIFETYQVDKNDPNVQRAIRDNGQVEVDFYEEQSTPNIWVTNTYYNPPTWNPPSWTVEPCVYYCNDNSGSVTFDANVAHTLTSGAEINISANNAEINLTSGNADMKSMERGSVQFSANLQETGRIEKGSHSDQVLEYDDTKFNSWVSWSQSWKIMPLSQKAYTREELKVFCTGCGAQRKKSSHKFCPHCGGKF